VSSWEGCLAGAGMGWDGMGVMLVIHDAVVAWHGCHDVVAV
jgi:hypothetical protein